MIHARCILALLGRMRPVLRDGRFIFVLISIALIPAHTFAGSITATVAGEQKLVKVWAVLRTDSVAGVHSHPFPGRVEGDKIIIENLEPGGPYDLRIQTDKGTLEGWTAAVPEPEDPDNPEPLDTRALRAVLLKMAGNNVSSFDDQVVILDIQGHGEHVVVLSTRLRTRPFTESTGVNDTTWVWRVDRWQWELVDGVTWVPWQERPFYALRRERMRESEYKALRFVFARHIGGIHLTENRSDVVLDTIQLPDFAPGIRAIEPDGTSIPTVRIKPGGIPRDLTQWPATQPESAKP